MFIFYWKLRNQYHIYRCEVTVMSSDNMPFFTASCILLISSKMWAANIDELDIEPVTSSLTIKTWAKKKSNITWNKSLRHLQLVVFFLQQNMFPAGGIKKFCKELFKYKLRIYSILNVIWGKLQTVLHIKMYMYQMLLLS